MRKSAIVITPFWASVVGAVLSSGVVGGIAYAWDNKGQQAVIQEKVIALEKADLPERMARIEETVKNTGETVDDIKLLQRDMSRKIDVLIGLKRNQ